MYSNHPHGCQLLLVRVSLTVALTALTALHAVAQSSVIPDTWVGHDGLGRKFLDQSVCGPLRSDRYVAMFYYVWHDPRGDVYDNTEILETGAPFGPVGEQHHWGQPEMGYYLANDPYVIRRHCAMLTNAGVDVIAFDATNGFLYLPTVVAVCDVFRQIRQEGGATPAITFFVANFAIFGPGKLYDDFYALGLYSDLWFRWNTKPLVMIAGTIPPNPEMSFFTARIGQWNCGPGGQCDSNEWNWLSTFPQAVTNAPGGQAEEIAVSCAGHPFATDVPNLLSRNSFRGTRQGPDRTADGLYFHQEWNRARAADPRLTFVTSWNEWVAQRHVNSPCGTPECAPCPNGYCQPINGYFAGGPLQPAQTYFIDSFNHEWSRDTEPATDGIGDAYYGQLVNEVRRYKGIRTSPAPSAPTTITIDGTFADWTSVGPEYGDWVGDTAHRDWPGYAPGFHYTDVSGRNDVVGCKVARDSLNLYFYARARDVLTPSSGANWMLLFLNTDGSFDTGWNGYDYLVNRSVTGAFTTSVSRWSGTAWVDVAQVQYQANLDAIEIAVPRNVLGLSPAEPLRFEFKWSDNIQSLTDVREFSLHGDSAPDRRFNYRFAETAAFPGRTIVVDDDYHVETGDPSYRYPANELGTALMPYNTFAEGYAQAQPGDRMVVLPNTFSVGNRLDRPVRIESAGGGVLRLQP
jgi:hypothetical protein